MVTRRLVRAAEGVQLALVLVILVLPIAWTFLSAFKPRTEVAALPPRLLFTPTLDNFGELFGRNDFLDYTLNSLIVATGSTVLGLALGVPAAFAVSWHRMSWPATATLFARMVPGTLFLLPWLIMFSEVGLVGSHLVLILTHAAITLPIVIWVLLPHFDSIPRELVECAQIDGARPDQILGRVVLPVAMSGVVVASILSFIFSWNYFSSPWSCPASRPRQQSWRASTSSARASPTGGAHGGRGGDRAPAASPDAGDPAPSGERPRGRSGEGMRAASFPGDERVAIVQADEPRPGPGEVTVRVAPARSAAATFGLGGAAGR
jgi:multiple sugar transport system permease protein